MKITKKNSDDGQLMQPLSLRDAMNRLFDESWWSPFSLLSADWSQSSGWYPKVDISETDKDYTIKANVPDIDPDKIDIEVADDSLSLAGSIERSQEDKGKNWQRLEREYGSFYRSFSFPHKVLPDSVKARSKNGVLTITVDKDLTTSGSRKVKIDVD